MQDYDDFELQLFDRLEVIKKIITKYGEDKFYVSFSGGKDSTVLHYMIDEALPGNKIPRAYMNTGMEYTDIYLFVKQLSENDKRIEILNSGINITQMLKKEGYPFKSKFHADMVSRYQKKGFRSAWVKRYYEGIKATGEEATSKFKCPKKLKYQFTDDFTLKISPQCCNKLKKEPFHEYEKKNQRPISILGLRKAEGGIRGIHDGCVLKKGDQVVKFKPLNPLSNEFMEWYIKTRNIQLSRLYYPPYNFDRTGCKGCPFALNLQNELDIMEKLLPNEKKQCEILWKPVYQEYRRIGYRLKKFKQETLFEED